jgi:hypothetical protein
LSKQVDLNKDMQKTTKIKRQHRFSIQSVGGCQLFSLEKENAQNYFDSGSSEK